MQNLSSPSCVRRGDNQKSQSLYLFPHAFPDCQHRKLGAVKRHLKQTIWEQAGQGGLAQQTAMPTPESTATRSSYTAEQLIHLNTESKFGINFVGNLPEPSHCLLLEQQPWQTAFRSKRLLMLEVRRTCTNCSLAWSHPWLDSMFTSGTGRVLIYSWMEKGQKKVHCRSCNINAVACVPLQWEVFQKNGTKQAFSPGFPVTRPHSKLSAEKASKWPFLVRCWTEREESSELWWALRGWGGCVGESWQGTA